MGDDVINLGGGHKAPLLQAFDTERILPEESLGGEAPFIAIAACGRSPASTVIFSLLLFL